MAKVERRNCLENRHGAKIEAPKAVNRARRSPDRAPLVAREAPSRPLRLFSKQCRRDCLKKARDHQKCECKRPEYGEKRLLALRRSLVEPTFDARRDFSDSLGRSVLG